MGSNWLNRNEKGDGYGQLIDLGFEGAKALNDRGQIIGGQSIYLNGEAKDITTLISSSVSYRELELVDINNRGQIAANAVISGAQHAVLLHPHPHRKGDFDFDGDVDGKDLALFIDDLASGTASIRANEFAEEFGR